MNRCYYVFKLILSSVRRNKNSEPYRRHVQKFDSISILVVQYDFNKCYRGEIGKDKVCCKINKSPMGHIAHLRNSSIQ